MKRGSRRDL
jgi:hypothetical protein